jgi:elongation factor Ts
MSEGVSLLKQLRETSGAGMLDCKKALTACGNDFDKSLAHLRKSGLAKAAKKASKVASEGLISIKTNDNNSHSVMVELNSQTDFVAKNDNFINLSNQIATHVMDNKILNADDLAKSSIDGETFDIFLAGKIAIIGENLVARRVANIGKQSDIVSSYIHGGGKIGVIIGAKCPDDKKQEVAILLKQICMHAAAMKPTCIDNSNLSLNFIKKEKEVIIANIKKDNEERVRLGKEPLKIPNFVSQIELSDEVVKKQEEIFADELLKQGKPEKIIANIVKGKIDRFIKDATSLDKQLCLLSQDYVFDDKKTIANVIKEFSENVSIVEYARFELGDGIEKNEDDFAAEVAAQLS